VRLLIDAHSLIWALDDPSRLSVVAASALQDPANQLLLGTGTVWELSIKVGLKKLALSLPLRPWLEKAITDLGLNLLPITLDHAERQAMLPFHHRDPFDRLLAAQAMIEKVSIVSADAILDQYGIHRVW
jgi:PIN domain nuclease of toxin-antitoxin system